MKRLYFIVIFSLLITSSCKPDDNSDENNNVQEYELIVTGNISDFINDDNKLRITKLIINSSILSDDWSLLSEMASIGSLEILDLTNVTIVGEEHNPYYNDNEIPEYAFTACNKLKEVYLPSNLQSIAKEAFSRCKKLKKVHFPETIEYIAPRAFYSTALSGEFFVPKNIKIIGKQAFAQTQFTKVILQSDVHSEKDEIVYTLNGNSVFAACENLTDLVVEDGCTMLELGFESCKS